MRKRRAHRRRAWLLLPLIVVACSSPPAPEADEPIVGPAGRAVALGERFDIRLPANPTTGYRWELGAPLDESIVRLLDSHYEAEPTDVVGSGGITVFTFEGVGAGRTNIELVYVRPWEKGVAPAREATYAIVVE